MINLIYDTNKSISLPETPEELTGKQLIGIAEILHGRYSAFGAKLKALQVICGLGLFGWVCLKSEVKVKAIEYVNWIFEEWYITKQLLPQVHNFYGPADNIENITLFEFYVLERYYADIIDGNANAINDLVAVLYREPKKNYDIAKNLDGDVRVPFNENATTYYSSVVRKWAMPIKQAILIWYDGCRKKIADDNPELFTGGDGGGEGDMFEILRSLSGGKYGDFEKVKNLNIYLAFREINATINEVKTMQKQVEHGAV